MSEIRLAAETRTEFGKGGARRTRRAGKVPAVVYGHGADPRHIALVAHDLAHALRKGGANALLTLEMDGGEQLAIPKSVTRHPIKGYFEHVDLLAVRRGEKVTVDVPVTVTGEVVAGGLLTVDNTTVSVEAAATDIPTDFEVDITELEIGAQVTAGDITLPSGVTLVSDPELLVLVVSEAPTAEDLEAEVAEAAEELGIVEDAPESEAAADAAGEGDAPAEGESASE